MWIRRHDEVEESRSVDRFSAAMHTLSRYDDKQRSAVSAHRSRDLDVHVSGASAPDAVAERRRRGAAQRRMRSLAGLVLTDLVVLILAAVTGIVVVWVLQILLDLAVAAFFMHLRRMAVQAAAARRRAIRRQQQSRELEAALAEPGWDEGVTIRREAPVVEPVYASSVAASQSAPAVTDDVFDQTAEADDLLAPAYGSVAASDGFFDQEADLSVAVDPEPSFIEAGVQRASRVVIESEDLPAAPPAEAVGGSPWEPIPVPKPTYAMKPAAPPRPTRRRTSEPSLPPVEQPVALDNDDDLEAILDRRWAVND
jgi:hypothetical protein